MLMKSTINGSFKFDMVKVVSIKDFLFRFVRKHAFVNLGQGEPIFPYSRIVDYIFPGLMNKIVLTLPVSISSLKLFPYLNFSASLQESPQE